MQLTPRVIIGHVECATLLEYVAENQGFRLRRLDQINVAYIFEAKRICPPYENKSTGTSEQEWIYK